MLFGRAFEQAVAAYFLHEGSSALWLGGSAAHRETSLEHSNRDTWDQMLQQVIQLLKRFAQEDRVRRRYPRRNLQIKLTRFIFSGTSLPMWTPLGSGMACAACRSGRRLPAAIRRAAQALSTFLEGIAARPKPPPLQSSRTSIPRTRGTRHWLRLVDRDEG